MKKMISILSLVATMALGVSAHASLPSAEAAPQSPAAAQAWLKGEQQAQLAFSFVCRWVANPYYYCFMVVAGPVGGPCHCPNFPNGYISFN